VRDTYIEKVRKRDGEVENIGRNQQKFCSKYAHMPNYEWSRGKNHNNNIPMTFVLGKWVSMSVNIDG